MRTFTNHSETLTRESELSLTTLKTLTQCGENSHPIPRWELWLVIQWYTSENSRIPSPSPGFSRRGATFLKHCIGCMQQPRGQTWNGGHRFQTGGPATTGPPAGDDPATYSVQNVTQKSENFLPQLTTFTYHSEWDSHVLQWKTSPQRMKTFTRVSPSTVRLLPANPNFHTPHWKLSPNAVITLTHQSENSHPPKWKLSPARVRTLTFGEKNYFYPCCKRGTESTLFLFSAAHSTFCCSAKIK